MAHLLPTPTARDWKSGASNLHGVNSRPLSEVSVLLPTPTTADGHGGPGTSPGRAGGMNLRTATTVLNGWVCEDGRDFGPAVHRWEEIRGVAAPAPSEHGPRGGRRLTAVFAEWMMGLDPGWVTDVVTDRSDALHVIGNGVVPRQAEAAFRFLMDDDNWKTERDDMDTTPTATFDLDALPDISPEPKPEKPRGACAGCRFDYQLGTARTGDHKGKLVVRKHNSRTGPGLCSGAGAPPREPETEDVYPVPHDRTTTGDSGDPSVQPAEVRPGDGVSGVDGVAEQGLRTDHGVGSAGEGAPADVPVVGGGDPGGSVDRSPLPEYQVCGPGSPGSGDAVGEHASSAGSVGAPQRQEDALPAGAPVRRGEHAVRVQGGGSDMPNLSGTGQQGVPGAAQGDAFMSPAPATVIPDGSVSMQPEPDRDRWSRYLLPGPSGKSVPHTRATTFAKAASSTFTLNQWQQRMTIAGLVMRPDLVALAHGLDVKADRGQLNSIAEQAKEAAGQKVAANLGTAYHAFSERLDAGLITLADVPEQYRPRLAQFQETVRGAGLTTRTEWIERSTAVRADQVSAAIPVAGTLDRIYQLPNGELVIGDLKTGADLSYGWGEIAVQLALYAHGVNTFGLFDWRTKTWQHGQHYLDRPVRTDFAIVVHLPAGGDGCTLHKVDLVKGWQRAQVCGQVMAMQADKGALSHPFTPEMAPALPSPEASAADDAWEHAKGVFRTATDQAHLAQLYQYAMDSGKFHTDQLATLVGIGKDRLSQLAK